MDAFGGSPASRVNKVIADMDEKYERELASHVNLIEINDAKITALDEKFTKELAVHSNIAEANNNKKQ